MTSLNDSWQDQRQQRQQEIAQRQEIVRQTLAIASKERQNKASQLYNDLKLFRETIVSEDQTRRNNFQQFQASLQQFRKSLRTETQAFLMVASDRRQMQAKQLAEQLDTFVAALQQQTAQFLTMAAADRTVMAEQLTRELQAFHQGLSEGVQSLRQELQAHLAELKADTQQFLAASQKQRLQTQAQLLKNLAVFMDALRSDVQSYLLEMETLRSNRATQLNNTLMQNRAERQAEMQALFNRLAKFRAELRCFHASLQTLVWGTEPRSMSEVGSGVASIPAPKVPVPSAVTTPLLPSPAPIGAFQRGDSVAVVPAKPAKPAQPEVMNYEAEVYNYIHQIHGARLTEIESSLGINRFQAVDALRSLIKKGMVTQRDRVYLAQEDLTHA